MITKLSLIGISVKLTGQRGSVSMVKSLIQLSLHHNRTAKLAYLPRLARLRSADGLTAMVKQETRSSKFSCNSMVKVTGKMLIDT